MKGLVAFSVACLVFWAGCSNGKNGVKEVEMVKKVMVSPLAGQWFQDSEMALRDEIAERCKDITAVRKKNVCAALVPHAGYRYSGKVAAGVYLRISPQNIRRIIVMGPSHYVGMHGKISVPDATHYATPLGELKADMEFIGRLRSLPFITHVPEAHTREHSDQIQLPLIQACLATNIPVVCMVCGQFDAASLVEAAGALRELVDEGTLFVASSDFTHYGANYGYVPFKDKVFENLETLDMGVFEMFARKDLAGFMRYLDETGATVCGRDPLAFLIAMMPAGAKVERTAYQTSGQMTHDTRNSVSYVGALVTGNWSDPAAEQKKGAALGSGKLAEEDCARLLKLARDTIALALKSGERAAAAATPEEVTDGMRAVRGGFVTLNKRGDLRGCIGEIVPRREIWKAVREQALNAAFNDPRFPALRKEELKEIDIEISILTPPQPAGSWREIEIGRHGMVLSKRGRSAVFLPQVAPEQGWGIEETLTHLAMKAGLGPDDWREGAEYLVFEAQIVSERD
jgi:AmmeMemoRadiSam system protein B/AmmeMemoRadiSam system protein A